MSKQYFTFKKLNCLLQQINDSLEETIVEVKKHDYFIFVEEHMKKSSIMEMKKQAENISNNFNNLIDTLKLIEVVRKE